MCENYLPNIFVFSPVILKEKNLKINIDLKTSARNLCHPMKNKSNSIAPDQTC